MVINIKLPVTVKIDNMGAVFMSEISASTLEQDTWVLDSTMSIT